MVCRHSLIESSISGAKVCPCSSRRGKVKPSGFVEKSSSFPSLIYPGERIYSPKPCTAKHYLFYAPETRTLLTGSDTA